jgi:phospholipid/cholesterol/gamma-HCH transport system substrate-binding protein
VKNKELLVGVFSVVVLTLLYFGFNFLKGIDFFSSTNSYYAKYDNVLQLTVSNPVLVNGFAVGRVSNIKLLPKAKNPVLVELEIDSDVKLGKGAKATLSTDLLGSKTILLDLGDQKNPIKDKDTIQAEIAKGMLDMISEQADPVVENVQTTLRKLNTLMDNLNGVTEELKPLFKKLQDTPGKVNNTIDKAGTRLDEISVTFKTISEKINTTLTELDPTLKNFKVLSDSLKQIELNKTLQKTQEALTGLTEVMAKLKKGDNTASKLMTDDELYVNLNKMLKSVDSLANHFNTHPKHFLSPLGKSSKKIERDHEDDADKKKN